MDEKIVQLTESSFGRKLVPDTPVYPIVLDRSVLVMDNEDNKYVPLDTLDLMGFIKLSEYFSKFIPFNDYVTGSLTVEEVYPGGATGTVVYSASKNAMLLKVPVQDEVLGSVVKYYYNWNDVDSVLGYSSKEYNDNHTIKVQRFFYTTTGALVIYKYDPTMRVLVPTAGGGSEIDPAYIEQVIDNIFESYINTAAHIKLIAYWVDENDELPDFASAPIDSYAYHVGHGLYAKYDGSLDWDTVESDTTDQFFYYDNSLYKWDGSELQGVIDTESMITSLRNAVNQYISNICTWKPISTYDELPMFDFPDDIYAYCDNKVWHSEDGEWVRKTSNGENNIDCQMFYDGRHIYQFVNNTLRTLFDFNLMLQDITSYYIGSLLKHQLKTINGESIWADQGENNDIQVLSPQYLESWISSDGFDASSNAPASQRVIAEFVSEFIENNKGAIIMPYYCCTQNQLPESPIVDSAWFDTANNKLMRITENGFQNFMGVNNAGLVFVTKETAGGIVYDVVLYVQTGASSNVVLSLTKGNGNSDTQSLPFYTPDNWGGDRPLSGQPIGSAFYDVANRRLYISSGIDIWGAAPEGNYLLHRPSTSEFYIFYQPAGGSAGVLTPLTIVDNALSTTSRNPVQNRVITPLINDLLEWKGRIILLDGEGVTAPDSFNYWYDPVNKILECKASGDLESFYEGVYLLISADRKKIYVYNADLRSDTQLMTSSEEEDLKIMINNRATQGYVVDAVNKSIGKVVSLRMRAGSGQYASITDWKDGEYYFDSTTNKLWRMGRDNLPKEEIGVTGEAYILIDRTYSPPSFYAWNVGTMPILLLTQSQGNSYANKTDFESWKSRIIAVDYWGGATPQNPTTGQIWYNPSPKTLRKYNNGWNDYLPSFAATSTYALLNKNDNCIYIAPNNGDLLRYPINALEDVYLNGTLVPSRDINGKRAVQLVIDSSLQETTVNKGEIISPYWGDLTGQETPLEGDYNIDDNNDLYKYVEVDGTLTWVEVTSGSYLLRKEEDSSEYLYMFTVGEEPIKLATYAEIATLTGGTTGISIGGNVLRPNVNGVISLSGYCVESSALGNYVLQSQFGSLQGQVSDLSLQNASVRYHGKAVCIAEEVNPSSISSSAYNSYATGDEISFVMSNNGVFLLRVINDGTTTYYRNWGRIVNTQISLYLQPSSDFGSNDLYFLQDNENLVFWIWDGTQYQKTVNFNDVVNKVNKTELEALPKVIALKELLQGSSGGIWTSENVDQYRIKNASSAPVLEKYNGTTFDAVSDDNLYILYYNRKLYYFKNSQVLGRAELVSFPNTTDYNNLKSLIPSKIIEVLHFGLTNGVSEGIDYVEGEIWYDNTEDAECLKYFDGEGFSPYNLGTEDPVLIYNREEGKAYVYFGNGDMRGVWTNSGNSNSGRSNIIVIKYWQNGDQFNVAPTEGDYWYDKSANANGLKVYSSGVWRADLIDVDALYISPTPDSITDTSLKSYGNTIYRWNGSNLIALSNDDELTSVLTDLAEELWQQSASLSNIVATAGRSFPLNAVIGQCYFRTDVNKPYWYAGQSNGWVDANGDSYNP